MIMVNIHEAKTYLSRLLVQVAEGEEVVIAKAGKPIARLSSWEGEEGATRVLGRDAGLFSVPEDFDAPLPDAVLAEFEG
ncbi:MAG: type II toxin-antitoxin system prevent-host-death family antitoxin [Thermodesulfobacteriota bacterium]